MLSVSKIVVKTTLSPQLKWQTTRTPCGFGKSTWNPKQKQQSERTNHGSWQTLIYVWNARGTSKNHSLINHFSTVGFCTSRAVAKI